jgi:hypothetical protein
MKEMQLSIVLCGRNDNYGGDFKSRLQNCINWTFHQLIAHQIHSEIIFVNYNPLNEIPIEEFIDWPKSNNYVMIRIITVPELVHLELLNTKNIKSVPFLEYFAKNAGIRRAKARFILSMNPDILIDERIFEKFKNLDSQFFYRCNRCDFNKDFEPKPNDNLKKKLSSDIDTVWYKGRKRKIDGFSEFKYFFNWIMQDLENFWKRNSIRLAFVLNYLKINYYSHNAEFFYHCNASGDFLLMDRKHWFELRAYKENSFISLHTDALFVIQAASLGLKEAIFNSPIYHKKHERRFDAEVENQEQRKQYLEIQNESQLMMQRRKASIYNTNDWGLINFELLEKTI